MEFQLIGVINGQRIVLCNRLAKIAAEDEHTLIEFSVNFTKQQLRFLNYVTQYQSVATLRPMTACVLQNDFVFDDYMSQFVQIAFGDNNKISNEVIELYD